MAVSLLELDDIVLAHTSDKLTRNINSSIIFEKSIQRTWFTLVMRVRLAICQPVSVMLIELN